MGQVEKNSAFSGLITTSHSPSHFLRKLSKLLTYCFPNSVRINRGSLNKKQLFNYCWNNQIFRLLIIHSLGEKNSAKIEIYNLEKSQEPIISTIEITAVSFPKKGIKEARIDANSISLHYSIEIPPRLREAIDLLMKPFLLSNTRNKSDSSLDMNIMRYTPHQILGNIVQTKKEESLEIFTFRVTKFDSGKEINGS